ncbi:MAG: FtsX-like permease family protein, partial [Opitutaceae bacterium]
MDPARYILRSLSHYRFAYLGALAGAVLGATVLLGALFAGDSVSASLQQIGEYRIGRATHLLAAGDRFFRQGLADEFSAAAQVRTAPVMYARGTATSPGNHAAANKVQLVGVTETFWKFAPTPISVPLNAATSSVAINETLARRLQVAVGDALIVRLQKPGILAGNAPVAGAEASLQNIRCTVAAIVGDASFGRFGLEATQIPPPSVFLPIELLQESFGRADRANLMLIDAAGSVPDLGRALASTVQLADYGLALRWLDQAAVFELTSDRIFIDREISAAVTAATPGAQPVVSYLVNELRAGDRTTPYSIATATTAEAAPFLPGDLGSREIVINQWLAEDLQAAPGNDVRLTFFQTGPAGTLVERSASFRVRSIVPLEGLAADGAWMPAFPGISNAENQNDWDPGLPLDLKRIRTKDENYWDDHRGAPKAFLSAAAGAEIWATRWGSATALRIPFDRAKEAELRATLARALRPEMNQLVVRDLRATAGDAAKSPVDFGGLFIGMSFFLIAAALGLVAMLFQFVLLQRAREDALLGAVGLSAGKVLRWRLGEGTVLLVIGALLGLPLAVLYTRGILRFLETIWSGKEGATSTFVFSAQPASIVTGLGIFVVCSLLAIWFAIRKQTRRTLSIRLAAHQEETTPLGKIRRTSRFVFITALAVAASALAMTGRGLPAQAAFYLAGFALLVAGIAACRTWIAGEAPLRTDATLHAGRLGALNLKARRSRSLTVVGLIATAVFMVLSVASFRKHVGDDWIERTSGTGGFAFLVETTAALNAARDGRARGFEGFERHAALLGQIVPLRVGAGDNANCFNLNSTMQPRLLGVDAGILAARGAFRLKLPSTEASSTGGWNVLQTRPDDGAIPALVDETTLLWALKKKIGDVLAYADENGRAFQVRIVGTIPDSIFQGHVLIDEQRLL